MLILGGVKTTVDIPDMELEDLMRFTAAATKRDAIVAAVTEFNRRKRMADLVKYSGTCDDLLSNEEIEAMDAEEFRQQFGESLIHHDPTRKAVKEPAAPPA